MISVGAHRVLRRHERVFQEWGVGPAPSTELNLVDRRLIFFLSLP